MKRATESHLLDFCVAQHREVDVRAWLHFSGVSRAELLAAASYLAGTSWYGHQPQLRAVVSQLTPMNFAELAQVAKFDASRFANLLKVHLKHKTRTIAA